MSGTEHGMSGFSLSRHNWTLHRKGEIDQRRHREKIKEVVRERLPEIIAEEAIITSDGATIVKVPIRKLELPRFRYGPNTERVGQGEGGSEVGDVIGAVPRPDAPGRGKGAGDMPGIDYEEAEFTIDDLAELLFKDLGLPNLRPKLNQEVETRMLKPDDIRRSGPMATLDKRRTIKENILRNALQGRGAVFAGIDNRDLRFRTWTEAMKKESGAVVIAMRDVSGSMGEFEKYATRGIYFWMMRFLRTQYDNVKIVFITHHTEAKEVDEETFFKLGESGGTKVSSAYELALDIIGKRFSPDAWNIYPFHFSDGDNWGDVDNARCWALIERLLKVSSIVGYGEIQEGGYHSLSTLMSGLSGIRDPRFICAAITCKEDVYPALRRFFAREDIDRAIAQSRN